MNFTKIRDVSGQSGDVTSVGTCCVDGDTLECVEKAFTESEGFARIMSVVENFGAVLERYGPHVFHADAESRTVYMEFLACRTVHEYCKGLDLYKSEDVQKVKALLESIEECLEFLEKENACHNDLHSSNMLVCDDGTVKLIDIDTISTREGRRCDDAAEIYDGICFAFMTETGLEREYEAKRGRLREYYNALISAQDDHVCTVLSGVAPEGREDYIRPMRRRIFYG
ncbi:unnamed protein product [Pylaiella littoralis]